MIKKVQFETDNTGIQNPVGSRSHRLTFITYVGFHFFVKLSHYYKKNNLFDFIEFY